MTCETCGKPHVTRFGGPACSGHANVKDDDGRIVGSRPCTKSPMKGQAKCGTHGGKSPQAETKAKQRQAEAKTLAAARKLIPDLADRTRIDNPLEALLELASEANAFRESLRVLANRVGDEIRYGGTGGAGEQLRAEVSTYRQALKDTADLLVAIARLDIEAMLARIEGRKVELVLEALTHGMNDAGIDEQQKRAVMAGVSRHLRSVRRPAA